MHVLLHISVHLIKAVHCCTTPDIPIAIPYTNYISQLYFLPSVCDAPSTNSKHKVSS